MDILDCVHSKVFISYFSHRKSAVFLSQITIYSIMGRRARGISGSLIWPKTLMELIFNPCGKFWGSPEGPIRQIHSPHLHVCPWDLFRSFNVCSDAKQKVGCEKQQEATASIQSPVKLQPWFQSLWWKTCLWTELQPTFLRSKLRTCHWAEH